MAKQEEKLTMDGKVVEALPNTTFRVKLENDYVVLAYLAAICGVIHICVPAAIGCG